MNINWDLKNDNIDPETLRCEEALECIPLAYEIDSERVAGQYKWYFSEDYWTVIQGGLSRGDVDPEVYRCSDDPDNCIPSDYKIKEKKGIAQFKKYFTDDEWALIKDDLKSEALDPEELRCGGGALECIP